MNSTPIYTRAAFAERRAMLKTIARYEGRRLAIVSVGLVLAQRLFIKWAEQQLDHPLLVVIIGGLFVIYAVLVGVLLIRLQRKLKAARIFCPQCGAALEGMSEHMATATGRCDTCSKAVWVEADWEGNR